MASAAKGILVFPNFEIKNGVIPAPTGPGWGWSSIRSF
jgi:hypothetical protein